MRQILIGIRNTENAARRRHAARVMRLVLLISSGCTSLPTLRQVASEINATRVAASTFLISDDQISVTFPRKPEWTHTVTVRKDGRAAFLFLDELVVAGMTMAKLHETLNDEYGKKKVLDPVELTVNLVRAAARRVVVTGEVETPGAVEIEGGHLSLIEAIGKAGGHLKESADLSETLLVRWLPKEGKMRTWRFDAGLEH